MDERSVATDSVGILALRVLLYAATFLTGIIVSRALGPTGRGEYYLPFLGATALVTVGNLGVDKGALMLFGDRGYGLGALWRVSRRVGRVSGVIGALLLVASPWLLPSVYAGAPILLLLIAAATVPLQIETVLGSALLTMSGRVFVQFRGAIMSVLVQTTLLLGLWASAGLTPAIVLVTGLAGAAVYWWIIVAGCREFERDALPAGWIREIMQTSLPLHASTMLLWMHLRIDMFMVSAMAGATMLGIYSLAVTLSETVQMATDSVGIALSPRQAATTVRDAAQLALTGARVNLVVGGLTAVAWLAAGPFAVPLLFGKAFSGTVLPLVVLLPGMVALGWQRACGAAIIRAGRPWVLTSIQGASLALNASLNWLLIPRFGVAGAAAASTVSYSLTSIAIVVWSVRLAGAGPSEVMPRGADLVIVGRGLMKVAGLVRQPVTR